MRRSPGSAISRRPRPHELRHSSAMPTASSPRGSSRDSDRDWMGARQSMLMVVWASKSPARAPVTSCPSALRSSLVESRKTRSDSYWHASTRSGVGWRRRCHRAGMVVSVRWVEPAAYPVRICSALRTTSASSGPKGTWACPIFMEPTRPRTRVSQRPKMIVARRFCSSAPSRSQSWARGPMSRGLIRVGMPGPMTNGSTPWARHSASYSSLGSPSTRVR